MGFIQNYFYSLFFLTFFVLSSELIASEEHIFEHNGSVVSCWFQAGGNNVEARYDVPRPGMMEEGLQEGTVLFKRQDNDGRIKGTEYTFKRGCAPAS